MLSKDVASFGLRWATQEKQQGMSNRFLHAQTLLQEEFFSIKWKDVTFSVYCNPISNRSAMGNPIKATGNVRQVFLAQESVFPSMWML